MKTRYFAALMGFVFLVTMGVGPVLAGDMAQPSATLSVSPSVAALDKKTSIVIMGSGFTPGQEVLFLTEDSFGLVTALDVVAVPNERGCFAEVWPLDRYASKDIIPEGVHSIVAADSNYNILATAPLALVDIGKDPEKWPEWAKAAGIKPKKKKEKKK